jgi:hypothetical protein
MRIEGNKYICFDLLADTGTIQIWKVINKTGNYSLGDIGWFEGWRQYVFRPNPNCEFNNTCLNTIEHFLSRLNVEKRIKG